MKIVYHRRQIRTPVWYIVCGFIPQRRIDIKDVWHIYHVSESSFHDNGNWIKLAEYNKDQYSEDIIKTIATQFYDKCIVKITEIKA